jgi:hypothetical protein
MKAAADEQKEIANSARYGYSERILALEKYFNMERQMIEKEREYKLSTGEKSQTGDINSASNAELAKLGRERTAMLEGLAKEHQNLRLAELESSRQASKMILDDETKTFSERLTASKQYELTTIEMIREQFAQRTLGLQEGSDEYKQASIELEDELTRIAREGASEREDITAKEVIKRAETLSIQAAILKQRQSEEEVALSAQYAEGTIKREEYERQKAALSRKYEEEAFTSSMDGMKQLLNTEELSAKDREDLAKQLAQKEVDYNAWKNDKQVEDDLKVAAVQDEIRKKKEELLKESVNAIFTFLSQASERRIAEIEAEMEAIEEQKARELELMESSVASEEDREARRAEIEARAAAKTAALEAKKKEEQRKQAVRDKAQGITSAIINTAIGVTGALKTTPTPLGIALAAIVGALGAIQVATIASQPIPKYARGTQDHPGGLAVTGDAGKSEMVITPAGGVFKTPSIPTLMDLPAHSMVLPDYRKALDLDLMEFLPEARVMATREDGILSLQRSMERNHEESVAAFREYAKTTREYMRKQVKIEMTTLYNSTLASTRRDNPNPK